MSVRFGSNQLTPSGSSTTKKLSANVTSELSAKLAAMRVTQPDTYESMAGGANGK